MEKKGLVQLLVVLLGIFMVAVIVGMSGSGKASEGIKRARQAKASKLIHAVRQAYRDPVRRQEYGLVLADGFISIPVGGSAYVDVHMTQEAIIVNNNGRMDIHDTDGDGTVDSCFDCSTGWGPEQIREDYEIGVDGALKKLGISPD